MHEKESHEKEESFSINTNQLALVGLAALFLMGAFQTWQLANTLATLNTQAAGANLSATASLSGTANPQSGTLDMSDWTANEKMNYEMHGTIPARAQGTAAPSNTTGTNNLTQGLPSQVGGC